jgi:hypothetical protein
VLSRLLPGPETGCLNSRGGARGRRLGPAVLGVSRARHRRVLQGRRLYSRRGIDRYCTTGGGAFRIGYPTARLFKHLSKSRRKRVRGRAVLTLTSSKRFSVGKLRPGDRVATLRRRLRGERRLRIGANTWYVANGRKARQVFTTRAGTIRAVGLAARPLTNGRVAERRFLRAWEL